MTKGKKTESGMATNSWIPIYTCLMILLMTFFILLLTISVMDQNKKIQALNSLVGAFGFKPGGQSILGIPKGVNISLGTAPMEKEEIMFETLRNVALKGITEPEIEVVQENERVVITLSDQVLFDYESDIIKDSYHPYLRDLASVLKDEAKLIELRGYVDPSEIVFDPEPLRKAMFLSTRRALAVFRFLHEEGQIPADNIVAHGFGANKPPKKGAKDKSQLNRQVEIILDRKDKVPYRFRKQERKGLWLDFKGFLFRYPGDVHE